MAQFVADSMTGTNWDDLNERQGEVGATWAKNGATPNARFYIYDGKTHCGQVDGSAGAAFYASGIPSSADYTVGCDYTVKTGIGHVGIAGRMSTTQNTYYFTYLDPDGGLILAKRVNGVITTLDAVFGVMAPGTTYQLELIMTGTTIAVEVDTVQEMSVVDASIAAAGRAGVRSGTVNDKDTGKHIDNFFAVDGSSPTPVPTAQAVWIGL